MIRDDEIGRLVNYIKGLGLKVIFSSSSKAEAAASCSLDNTEITIFLKNNKSKTDIVLSLIHEAGHASHAIWQHNRVVDKSLEKAMDKQDTSKKARKKILQDEKTAASYWDIVVRDTNIKLPKWRIELQKEYDIWQYEEFYQTGKFPNQTLKNKKFKELKQKWRSHV